MAAALDVDHPAPNKGDPIPNGWHGAFFTPAGRLSELREDGLHLGDRDAPPLPIPPSQVVMRRYRFHDALRIGDELTKEREIAEVSVDETHSPPQGAIVIRETISSSRGPAITEDLVRIMGDTPLPTDGPSVPDDPTKADWQRTYEPDPMMMFRLSAVRFNAHRIHYDRPYTTEVEGLPGLVVPNTLISALMTELCRTEAPDRPLATFDYRVDARIYDLGPFTIFAQPHNDRVQLWSTGHDGVLGTIAEARFAS